MSARRSNLVLYLVVGLALVAQTAAWAQDSTPPTPQQPPPASTQAPKSTADDNPFPESESKAAEKAANAAEKAASDGPADAPTDSASGSSDAASGNVPESSSRTRMKGIDLLGDNDSRTSDGAGHVVNDPKLSADDVRIGQLYMGDGNYVGAYQRFKEATVVGPGNADAVFFLAEAARKTAHLDEAATNYKLYLDAEPKGKRAKDAKKALAELAGN